MSIIDLDSVAQFVEENQNNAREWEYLRLPNDNDSIRVRFMYGPGEKFQPLVVHNLLQGQKNERGYDKNHYVPCQRTSTSDPLSACPFCSNGYKLIIKYFIPCYDVDNNKVLFFERGSKYTNNLREVMLKYGDKPLCNYIFRITRLGGQKDSNPIYAISMEGVDGTTMENLPAVPKLTAVHEYTPEQIAWAIQNHQVPPKQDEAQPAAAAPIPRGGAVGTVPMMTSAVQPQAQAASPFPSTGATFAQPNQTAF